LAGVSSETHWLLSSCFFITKFFTGCLHFSELMGSALLILLLVTFYEKCYFFLYKYFKLSLLKMFKFKFKFWHSMGSFLYQILHCITIQKKLCFRMTSPMKQNMHIVNKCLSNQNMNSIKMSLYLLCNWVLSSTCFC
jgi:hypothetical protein